MSCGVASRTGELTGPAELLRAADEAQYRAKRRDDVDVVVAGETPEEPPARRGVTARSAPATRRRLPATCSTCSTP